MPKSLQEIKNFNTGVILNASERDTSLDTPAYSLNIETNTEEGILDSIRNNRLVFNITDSTIFEDGATNGFNGTLGNTSGKLRNNSSHVIRDISILEDLNKVNLYSLGKEGVLEQVSTSEAEPILNPYYSFGDSQDYPTNQLEKWKGV